MRLRKANEGYSYQSTSDMTSPSSSASSSCSSSSTDSSTTSTCPPHSLYIFDPLFSFCYTSHVLGTPLQIDSRCFTHSTTLLASKDSKKILSANSSLALPLSYGAEHGETLIHKINQRADELKECGDAHIQEQLHQYLFMKLVMTELLLPGAHIHIYPGVCFSS